MTESFGRFFLQYYGLAVLAVGLFLVFIFSNKAFSPMILRYFFASAIIVVLLAVSDSLQCYMAYLDHPTKLRMFFAACAYTLRVLILYFIVMLFCRGHSKAFKRIITIPAVINTLAAFSAFATPLAFYYTADNVIVRGPVITIPFIVSFIYFLVLLYAGSQEKHKGDHREVLLVTCMFIFATVTTVMEAKWHYRGVLSICAIICLIVYYMHFLSDKFGYDQLTDAAMRNSLYEDIRGYSKIYGVVTFDLNNLKIINDTQGHLAGDKALVTISHTVIGCLPEKAKLYRIGGDEFVVLYRTDSETDLRFLAERMKKEICATPYRAAIGYALRKENEELEKILARSDLMLYEDKAASKADV